MDNKGGIMKIVVKRKFSNGTLELGKETISRVNVVFKNNIFTRHPQQTTVETIGLAVLGHSMRSCDVKEGDYINPDRLVYVGVQNQQEIYVLERETFNYNDLIQKVV